MVRDFDDWTRGEVFAAIVLATAFLSVMIPAAIAVSHQPATAVTLHLEEMDGKV